MAKGGRKRRPESEEEGSDDGDNTVDVTFDFFDLDAIDYHAMKHLLSQLLSLRSLSDAADAAPPTVPPSQADPKPVPADIDVGELADLVLGPQKEWVGGTVKCDGEASDPYAFVSVLDLKAHPDRPSVAALTAYFLGKLASSASPPTAAQQLHERFSTLVSSSGSGVGLLLSERLVNMPVQIMPHMLRQVGEEIAHAQSRSAPGFAFSHLLVPSRVFVAESEAAEDNPATAPGTKKRRKDAGVQAIAGSPDVCLFHPEDEIISRFSSDTVHFPLEALPAGGVRPEDSFGVEQRGRLMLIELAKWAPMVEALEEYIGGPQAMQVD